MDEEILKTIAEQGKKLDLIYKSVESTRRYFLWTLIISVAVIVLPLIGLAFAVPKLLGVMSLGQYGL